MTVEHIAAELQIAVGRLVRRLRQTHVQGQLTLVEARGRISGTILIDGMVCTFRARLKDGYDGTMRCPDRRDMPITLSVD